MTDPQVSEETRNHPLVQACAGPIQDMLEGTGTGLSLSKLWDCTADDFSGLLLVASGPEYQQRAMELAPWGFGLAARGPKSGFIFHLFLCASAEDARELLALLQRDTALTVAAMGERFQVEFPPPVPFTFNARPAEGGEPLPIATGFDWDTNPEAEGCLEARSAQGVMACGRILVRAAAMDNVGRPAIGELWMSLLQVLMQAQG